MEIVELEVEDGTLMKALVERPASGGFAGPGIILFQEAYGVNAHVRNVAQRLADAGLTAIAPQLFHRTAVDFEIGYEASELAMQQASKVTTEGMAADATAAYEWLTADASLEPTRIASIGFCLGGRASYIANATLPLRAAISFYGGRIAPNLLNMAGRQQAPILMFWGGLDQHIPPEQYRAVADALTAAKKEHEQVVFSHAGHGFFCDERASYNAAAASQAWVLVLEFLRTTKVLT